MNKERVLNLLGLAMKAGKVASGEDTVLRMLKQNKLMMVFVASDASERQIDKFDKKCFFYQIKMNNTFTSAELSKAIGKTNRKVVAVTDKGFLEALTKNLNGGAINEG